LGEPDSSVSPALRHPPIRRLSARIPQLIAPISDAEAADEGDRSHMHIRSYDTPRAVRKLHDLEHVAEVGESDKTPLILMGEVWVVSASAVLVLLALALLAYRLAS